MKKTLVIQPGLMTNATTIESGLSWMKKYDTLPITIRTRNGVLEYGVLDATWHPGQKSRLPFLRRTFINAASAVGIKSDAQIALDQNLNIA
eukprot:10858512-Karenia_brevis.AAC.1